MERTFTWNPSVAQLSPACWNCFFRHISCIFVIFFETNLFLLSHGLVLALKIGRTALNRGFFRGTEDEKTFVSVRKLGNFKNVSRKTLQYCWASKKPTELRIKLKKLEKPVNSDKTCTKTDNKSIYFLHFSARFWDGMHRCRYIHSPHYY